DPVSTKCNKASHMLHERPPLGIILQMNVRAKVATSPWHDTNLRCNPLNLGEERAGALGNIPHMPCPGPPARPALCVHRPKEGIDAADTPRAKALDERNNLGLCGPFVHPVAPQPNRIVAAVIGAALVRRPRKHLITAARAHSNRQETQKQGG